MNSPKAQLKKVAAEAREMHRLYPFTKTVSSAKQNTDRTQRVEDERKT